MHFGNNWDALVDSWSDLSWLPGRGYVCVLLHANAFKKADRESYNMLATVAGDVAERWKEHDPTVAFKLVRCG